MSVEKETRSRWIELNDFEQAAQGHFNNLPVRDFEARPWTIDDEYETKRDVVEIATRLLRVEQRLEVLYRIADETLRQIKLLALGLAIGAISLLAWWWFRH